MGGLYSSLHRFYQYSHAELVSGFKLLEDTRHPELGSGSI